MAPGGTFPSQRWPVEQFAEAGSSIRNANGASLFVFGSPAEEEIVHAVAERCDAVVVCDLPLERVPDAIAALDVLICNNSGPLHVAAAVGTPTVSVMGPTIRLQVNLKSSPYVFFLPLALRISAVASSSSAISSSIIAMRSHRSGTSSRHATKPKSTRSL